MDARQTVRMNPGEGETSYASNSKFQVRAFFSQTTRMKMFSFRRVKTFFSFANIGLRLDLGYMIENVFFAVFFGFEF